MIDGPPEGVSFAVDPDKNFIQMPAPLRPIPMRSDSLFSDLCGEHWTKPVPPGTNRLIADFDSAFVKQILNLPQ